MSVHGLSVTTHAIVRMLGNGAPLLREGFPVTLPLAVVTEFVYHAKCLQGKPQGLLVFKGQEILTQPVDGKALPVEVFLLVERPALR